MSRNPDLDPKYELTNMDLMRQALDDAATIEAKNRINMNRGLAFLAGAAGGLLLTVLVLKVRK